MRWKLHGVFEPFTGFFLNAYHMSKLSKWRSKTKVNGYNDWYQGKWDYSRRYNLYEEVSKTEKLDTSSIDYFEFGVCGGHSFKWWLEHNKNADSKFYGFDTFEGLPENWGTFKQGDMTSGGKFPEVNDARCTFVKGLFQDTLPGKILSIQNLAGRRKVIHLDADLYSSTLYVLTSMAPYLRAGDILIFDEFNVPLHEFKALMDFESAYYIKYDVIASMNNYFHVALKLK